MGLERTIFWHQLECGLRADCHRLKTSPLLLHERQAAMNPQAKLAGIPFSCATNGFPLTTKMAIFIT